MDFQVPNTLAEQIANYLAEHIMTGQIKPGQRLHEATTAKELQVSRASVKEALYTLERWHLIEITRAGARRPPNWMRCMPQSSMTCTCTC